MLGVPPQPGIEPNIKGSYPFCFLFFLWLCVLWVLLGQCVSFVALGVWWFLVFGGSWLVVFGALWWLVVGGGWWKL